MKYQPAIKKNDIIPFVAMRINLEIITPSEVNQTKTDKYQTILLICGI